LDRKKREIEDLHQLIADRETKLTEAFDSVRVPVRLRRLSGIGFAITNPSTDEDSLTEAPAPSLLHIEVKMALVGFIGTRSQHGAEDAASVIVD
jgi:hypothetical protein